LRFLAIGACLAALAILVAGCGGSSASSSELDAQHEADLYHVTQIERNWHKATSTQDIDLMMSLWAPDATFTVASGETLTGTDAIRGFWLKTAVFQPENLWVSETPAYKLRATVNGDKGTLYFECHYVDPETAMVVAVTAADQQVARINGEWLITNNVGAAPLLTP
jgi:hypothetical protein